MQYQPWFHSPFVRFFARLVATPYHHNLPVYGEVGKRTGCRIAIVVRHCIGTVQ